MQVIKKRVYTKEREVFWKMNNIKNKMRNINGITLIALVITVIILLILAGISIAILTGNGLFEKAKLAKEKQENAQIEENEKLLDYENKIESNTEKNIDGSRDVSEQWVLLAETTSSTVVSVTLLNNERISNYNSFVLAIYSNNETLIRGTTYFSRDMFMNVECIFVDYWATSEGTVKYNSDTSVFMSRYAGNVPGSAKLYGIK